MIVAIDGPAGSGKSTIAKEIARQLGFNKLDTAVEEERWALERAERDARSGLISRCYIFNLNIHTYLLIWHS